MGSQAAISQRHIFLYKRVEFKGPDTTILNDWNKIKSFKKKLRLWLNMIAEGNNEMFQSYSDYARILWKQMIYLHRIQFQILLHLT